MLSDDQISYLIVGGVVYVLILVVLLRGKPPRRTILRHATGWTLIMGGALLSEVSRTCAWIMAISGLVILEVLVRPVVWSLYRKRELPKWSARPKLSLELWLTFCGTLCFAALAAMVQQSLFNPTTILLATYALVILIAHALLHCLCTT